MRLLYWNIQRFSQNTLDRINGHNLLHIFNNVNAQDVDIFVIVEVQSNKNANLGTLVTGKGQEGVLYLLNYLRANQSDSWCLVPPLKLVDSNIGSDYTEAIAIFYKSARLNFIGPYVWPNEGDGIPVPSGVTTKDYPEVWSKCLPPNNHFAGQFKFFEDAARTREIKFPEQNSRRPFLTKFREVDGHQRVISLLSIHTKPGTTATTAVARITDIYEMKRENQQNNEIVILAGDFNIDVINPSMVGGEVYRELTDRQGFTQHFARNHGPTMLKKVQCASPLGQPPGYGYLGTEGLDNIFTRYHQTIANTAPVNHNAQIINRVVGSPPSYPIDMTKSIPWILAQKMTDREKIGLFQSNDYYGHIGPCPGVSDHMPLVIDI
jgi:hypothetical protein